MFSNEITAPGAVDKCFVADLAKNLLDRISNWKEHGIVNEHSKQSHEFSEL